MNKNEQILQDIINKLDTMTKEELKEELEKWKIEFVDDDSLE